MIKTAIIPVAGRGTRLHPVTLCVPKELLPVYTTPLLQFAIEEAEASGIERFIFVTRDGKEAIEDFVRMTFPGIDAHFLRQAEPLGLGHAVLTAGGLARQGESGDLPVAVILPDDLIFAPTPVLAQMARAYDTDMSYHMVAAMKVAPDEVSSYGIVDADVPAPGRAMPVRGLVEKPAEGTAPSTLAVVGRYILHPGIFETLMTTGRGAGGEIQLTDAIARDLRRMDVSAFRFEGVRFDCGVPDGLLEAGCAIQDAREMLEQGSAA
ncbi:sugar phosphate nucleotidyltransferase [Roseibacterium sp. SDUM158017]|uniref:UTP--glucose-1-phosphate uridylyltransferase n=1 Tax=Roseicyclus salinarum TaxID=3036773 RepID=UPI002414DE80|nr:sugar phosphate nucleotidyltransferase [Roseibacterium sp. SDUM158017]MDG4650498.1 sugar phosphate nucleotidyltransferase [Roseibacterium sp. SDUM158017]